jgi:hypothetical protein
MTVSYINLMKAQQKRYDVPSSVCVPVQSRDQMIAAGRAARARLMGHKTPKRVITLPGSAEVIDEAQEAATPEQGLIEHYAPLNMLTMASCRFLTSVVALQTGIAEKTLIGPAKLRHVVEARDKLIKLIFEHTQHSLPMIGKAVHRDHTTVLHSLRKSGCYYRLVDIAATTDPRSRGAITKPGKRDVIVIEPSPAFRTTSLPVAEEIIDQVCEKHGFTPEDLMSSRRGRSLGHARQEAIYRIVKETKLSQADIGRIMGHRDPHVVAYSVKAHEARLSGTKYLRRRAA